MSLKSNSQEKITDDTIQDASSIIGGSFRNVNPHEVSMVSIGVGPDVVSSVHSFIEQTTNDECKYTGDVYEEKKHGKGVLSWADGRTYTGAFFADRRHGFGIFHVPNTSEFKGLYCHDERFGPGILIYQSLQSADVGLWLSEDLIRLLYPHPKLILDIHITDKKCSHSSSSIIPSWYSPEELLRTVSDFNLLLKKKSPLNFLNENKFLTRFINEHPDGAQEAMHNKRTELDAYLSSIYDKNDINELKNRILNERTADILPPNETYEQRLLYNYANKFWPLKQRASFPIDDIISSKPNRSSFPNPGPLENASLNLFELSYYGYEKDVRHLLMQHLAYVDVCDSHGLTALHFATYNIHINIISLLLDFGANVNQLSDDGLTPLILAFLLYYGNDHQQTINIALEHVDPIIPNPRILISKDKNNSIQIKQEPSIENNISIVDELKLPTLLETMKINDSEKSISYGFELTGDLRERIRDEQFRESVYSVIVLLLRRGADPSYSDWPLPVLIFAVRAGDKQMVELLLKKKAKVNCRLNAIRHASLTPLHVACGCLSPNVIDIARLLLEHGADVNAESFPNNQEYLTLVDPLVIEINKTNENQQNGRTPLHIACTREASVDTLNLIRLLLQYQANPNAVCNGQTPLSLAIALGNESVVDLLLNHETTDPSTVLGYGNGNALCMVLSTFYENRWTYPKRLQLIERLMAKNPRVLYPVRFGPKNLLGSAVDFAYYMFFADTRISQSPYHSLTNQERIIFNQRKELLAFIAKRFREEVSKYEGFLRLPTTDLQSPMSSPVNLLTQRSISQNQSIMTDKTIDYNSKLTGEFRYCGTCGRNTGVRLAACKRCQKTSFCSKPCLVNGWNTFHRYECRQSASRLSRPYTTTNNMASRNKNPDSELFKDGVLLLKNPSKTNENNRLPPVSKILRQNRMKKRIKSASLEGIELSWNPTYNAPENYSFN
ncbi:unnamed protein product [Adineta steineri]|uniref:MYND-type domain-containing protein n=1 Tax=Adineta steineri TaxID=433720 RepID=A0A815DWE4_9BILA|nr:unnamed protein product [Adineta steineri]CAF1576673.1 unnamed protein product [Adineta steineri]